jgi:hypothetical protein
MGNAASTTVEEEKLVLELKGMDMDKVLDLPKTQLERYSKSSMKFGKVAIEFAVIVGELTSRSGTYQQERRNKYRVFITIIATIFEETMKDKWPLFVRGMENSSMIDDEMAARLLKFPDNPEEGCPDLLPVADEVDEIIGAECVCVSNTKETREKFRSAVEGEIEKIRAETEKVEVERKTAEQKALAETERTKQAALKKEQNDKTCETKIGLAMHATARHYRTFKQKEKAEEELTKRTKMVEDAKVEVAKEETSKAKEETSKAKEETIKAKEDTKQLQCKNQLTLQLKMLELLSEKKISREDVMMFNGVIEQSSGREHSPLEQTSSSTVETQQKVELQSSQSGSPCNSTIVSSQNTEDLPNKVPAATKGRGRVKQIRWVDACPIDSTWNKWDGQFIYKVANLLEKNCQKFTGKNPMLALKNTKGTKTHPEIQEVRCQCAPARSKATMRIVKRAGGDCYMLQFKEYGDQHACGNPISLKKKP